ncbi:MAG: hypothetical protein O6704_09615 [Nitrospinae bacterium]|nr:hypothetical protein [Nitrospinota bacterium]
MQWKKLGRVFVPDNHHPWMETHAANPVVEHLDEDIYRVYFSGRDNNNRSSIGYVDVDINPPFKIIGVAPRPLVVPGERGMFDDSGVSLGCIVNVEGRKFLYYLGWNLGVTVPWRNSIGLAIFNEKSGMYEKFGKAPLLDRCEVDPYTISYPYVMKDGNIYRMWYGSSLGWGKDWMEMAFVIKYAESHDGIHWNREGHIALNFKSDKESAIARAFVLNEKEKYKMWYSYRGDSYRIGYAESTDGLAWTRKDELAGIDVSDNGWDSEMIEYPHVFDHKDSRYMFYNGNGFGKTGFGLAVLEHNL